MEQLKVLVADDEPTIRDTCTRVLKRLGFATFSASSGTQAINIAREHGIGLAVLDIKMPELNGLETLSELKKLRPDARVIMITGFSSVQSVVEAMRFGASDYLLKPFSIKDLEKSVRRAFIGHSGVVDLVGKEYEFMGLVGKSPPMLELRRMIELVSSSDATALIIGETGTGKELVARAIHKLSPRASEPFVPIDCSVIGERIAESELFGHKKGSFTDAHSDKIGLLEAAGKGIVFLDEITNIPLHVQAKLLRALQEKEIRPIGSTEAHQLEARVLAASNADLAEAVRAGRFREDLFYRLHVVPIHVPPLRARREDIPLLLDHFVGKYSRPNMPPQKFEGEAMQVLASLDWPGNVRELESFVRMVLTVVVAPVITKERVEQLLAGAKGMRGGREERVKSLEEAEREAILSALSSAAGDKHKAAETLGLAVSTLYRKLKKFGIDRSQ
ncbi:MAG: sigma-54 dependent transcriptional regulator [Candidatus Eisenbacteria bacterium]|nr:sigma-54 dependent transcriptional regulator [Candidatus Eisenbacteria bacterium]